MENRSGVIAGGPPPPVLLMALRKLGDLRSAAERDDIPSRYSACEPACPELVLIC